MNAMKRNLIFIFFVLSGFLSIISAYPLQYQEPIILGSQQGLSSTKVNNIVQDDKGFIWIATEDGLNKYDGHHFAVYKKSEGDSTSLINNNITSLYYDSEGRLWVGSMIGLQYYNAEKDNFTDALLGQSKDVMQKNSFLWIMEDSHRNIWFSIYNQGVLKYSLETKTSVLYKSVSDGGHLSSKSVRHIMEDRNGDIWFTSFDNGISIYKPSQNAFYYYNTGNSNLPTNSVLRVCELSNGNILVATRGFGVYILNKVTQSFEKTSIGVTAFAVGQISDGSAVVGTEGEGLFYVDNTGENILSHPAISTRMSNITASKIHSLYEDANGDLWIGMYNDGVCYLRREPEGFVSYRRNYDNPNSLSYGQITGITTDNDNNVWFATDGGGLNSYNKSTGKYTHYIHVAGDNRTMPDDAVVSVFRDSKGTIWAGTYIGGLCRFDKSSGSFISYQYMKGRNSVPDNYVKCIVEDRKGNLWLGTDGKGISYFDILAETFTNYSSTEQEGLIFDNVTCLYLQDDKTLWIGTHVGICRMDTETEKFVSYQGNTPVNNLTIYSINEDSHGTLWLGTTSGLYKYDPNEDDFQHYDLSSRFDNIVVNGIIPYNEQLWLSTNEGVICYIPEHRQIKYFLNSNDLDGINFIRSSYYISPNNEIFFGGSDGCYAFYPGKLNLEEYSPKVYITDLEVFNEPVFVGRPYKGHIILDNSLDFTKQITLKHSENSLTFRFSSPTILFPASVYYMCFMEGIDKQWMSFPHTQQSVTYANLPPGKYMFHVYASNIPNQHAQNITTLTIEILPPFWLTWWAKLGYVIFTLLLLGLILWIVYIRMKDRNELRMERIRAKEQEELNQSKMQFFTNISHEFRTPLTLIIAPLEEMQQSESDKQRSHIMKMMLRNANRLLRLINQILDLRKAENNKIEINAQPIDLVKFVQDFTGIFSDIVHRKNISLSLDYNVTDITIWYDPDLLEKCLYNLLSNALKYTKDGGKIRLSIEKQTNGDVELNVEDNGKGIAEDEIPYLFDRFYQGEYSKGSGTGIGLHLVKTIVELHRGYIGVGSEEGAGSHFTIYILGGKEHLNPDDCNEQPWVSLDTEKELEDRQENLENIVVNDERKCENTDRSDKPTIFLVEDELDMRMYIRHELADLYHIEEASNGREALNRLQTLQPDLIVTDVMMPEIDGIEFTRMVKENIETCHIPVILLTANSEVENRLEGLETGADSYIVKPFNTDYLRVRIRKLLEIRQMMREKFTHMLNLEAQEVEVVNPDEILLQNSISYIRSNISETQLSVEEIAKQLNISRTNLHRKIKMLTGLSPVELIRTIRMKQAAYLLETGSLTISEVAYEVGYNSLSYFSSSFNSYWGLSPSAYIKNNQDQSE